MYWKLTNDIWWGDYLSVAELKDQVGSVICLATNGDLLEKGYNPIILPPKVRYFRMAEKDMSFPDATYIKSLEEIIKVSLRYKPLLVHCYIGQHRSPIIAVMAALIDSKDYSMENYINLVSKVIQLRTDCLVSKVIQLRTDCADVMHFNFTKQIQSYIKTYILNRQLDANFKLDCITRASEE